MTYSERLNTECFAILANIFLTIIFLIILLSFNMSFSEAKSYKTDRFAFAISTQDEIVVQANEDGEFDRILTETIKVSLDFRITMERGRRVREYAFVLGNCNGNICREWGSFPVLFSQHDLHTRSRRDTKELDLPISTFLRQSNNAIPSQGLPMSLQTIFNACKTSEGTETSVSLSMTALVDASWKKIGSHSPPDPSDENFYPDAPLVSHIDLVRRAVTPLKIRCIRSSEIISAPRPKTVTVKAKRFGKTCPADIEVSTKLVYWKPVTSNFRIRHNGKNGKLYSVSTKKVQLGAKTLYVVDQTARYKVDPGTHQFRTIVQGGPNSKRVSLNVKCPPFKVTSAWLNYDVEPKETCKKSVSEEVAFYANGPGKVRYHIKNKSGQAVRTGRSAITIRREGDRYVGQRTRGMAMGSTDDIFRLEAVGHPLAYDQKPLRITCLEPLKGKVTLRQYGSPSECKGEAMVAIHTNRSGTLPYELECGVGKSWARSVKAPGANKIGVDKVIFDVKNNERVTCALRSRIGNRLIPLHGTNKLFQCIKSNQVNRPGGLTLSPPQSNNQPQTCPAGSTRRNGKCVTIALACPKGWTRFRRASQIPRNWDRRTIEKGRSVVYCGRKKTVRVCPKGTTGVWPRCKKTQKKCPRGTKGIWPNCRKVQKNCPRGTTGVWPKCKKIQKRCPRGTTGIWPKCKKVIRKCPRGTKGTWPNCRKIIRKCPRGTVGVWPRCRKVPQACRRGFIRFRGKCIRRPEG